MTEKKITGKIEREKPWPSPLKEKCPYCSGDDWSGEHGRFSVLIGDDMKRAHRKCHAKTKVEKSNVKIIIR